MGLLSIFKRDREDAPVAPTAAPSVQQARTRARRRLIGATLLVLMGIVGFPLVFESQPRPIPVDIPIDIPRPEGAAPLAIPPARSQVIVVEPPVPPPPAPQMAASAGLTSREEIVVGAPASTPAHAGAGNARPTTESLNSTPSAPASVDRPAAAHATAAPASRPAADPRPSSRATAADTARAQALLNGRDARAVDRVSPAQPGRFVVQVGAFADAAAAREVRQKVEKLGVKTYTQSVETSSGTRIRVRVGPMESKDQAEKAQARLKAAGLPAVVLTL